MVGLRSPTLNFGGGSSGPTLQQQQEMTQQALTNANLNLEENSERKSILNAMLGTRVFRGSALSRALRGNTPGGEDAAPGPSRSQLNAGIVPVVAAQQSLLDQRESNATGATTSGGAGASASPGAGGGYVGGGGRGGGMRA
jgi:hypothetical protein